MDLKLTYGYLYRLKQKSTFVDEKSIYLAHKMHGLKYQRKLCRLIDCCCGFAFIITLPHLISEHLAHGFMVCAEKSQEIPRVCFSFRD